MKNVIMMHSVGSNHTNWKESWLSVDAIQFEALCKFLHDNNYRTHHLDHWYETNGESKDKKDWYLTFDDGYLDNLLVAYPIMRKYGIKGTIFVNPEFVDPSSGVRTLSSNKGQTLGFLNWDEIQFLDSTEEFDIQSHSMSHNFYFSSNELVAIHDGSEEFHWLAWYAKPERKAFWQLEEQGSFTIPGTPVFKSYRALGLRRYFPDDRLTKQSIEWYNDGIRGELLMSKVNELLSKYPGRFETDEEMVSRFRYELFESKQILEEKLHKKVDFLCWPGGGYNELSLKLAIEAGYKASTIASRDCFVIPDNRGKEYKRIARFGMSSSISIGKYFRTPRFVSTKFKYHLVWCLISAKGNPIIRLINRAQNFILYCC